MHDFNYYDSNSLDTERQERLDAQLARYNKFSTVLVNV